MTLGVDNNIDTYKIYLILIYQGDDNDRVQKRK